MYRLPPMPWPAAGPPPHVARSRVMLSPLRSPALLPLLYARVLLTAHTLRDRQSACGLAGGWTGDVYRPDLPGESDDVRGGPNELDRGRLVQPALDGGEGAVRVDPDQRACVRPRRVTRVDAVPDALRQ